jgi:cholesterol transport system auxiliary component
MHPTPMRHPSPRPALAVALLVALAVAGAGCSVLPKREPTQVFAPSSGPVVAGADWPTVSWALLVAKPSAGQQIDSERIGVRPGDGAVQVYHAASWSDPATDLVQTALVRGFEDSGKILAVARPGSGVHGDYSLQTEVRSFTSVYEGGTPQAVVEVYARLVHPADGGVVGAQLFREVEPAAGTDVAQVVDAFSRALNRTRDRMIGWTLQTGQAHEARASAAPPKP